MFKFKSHKDRAGFVLFNTCTLILAYPTVILIVLIADMLGVDSDPFGRDFMFILFSSSFLWAFIGSWRFYSIAWDSDLLLRFFDRIVGLFFTVAFPFIYIYSLFMIISGQSKKADDNLEQENTQR